jgi:flagellar FliL protein
MASSEKSPATSEPAQEGEPKGSSPLALVLALIIVTVLAAGTGGLIGLFLQPQAHQSGPAPAQSKAEHQAKEAGGHGTAGASLKVLAPVTTNLSGQKSTWVRLETAIVLEGEPPADVDVLGGKITDDILAFMRTVPLAHIEGPSGYQNLREDLNDLVLVRSGGKVRELVVQTLIIE